jgi:hypothetical protein
LDSAEIPLLDPVTRAASLAHRVAMLAVFAGKRLGEASQCRV